MSRAFEITREVDLPARDVSSASFGTAAFGASSVDCLHAAGPGRRLIITLAGAMPGPVAVFARKRERRAG